MSADTLARQLDRVLFEWLRENPQALYFGVGATRRLQTAFDEDDAQPVQERVRDLPAGGRLAAGLAAGAARVGNRAVVDLYSVDDLLAWFDEIPEWRTVEASRGSEPGEGPASASEPGIRVRVPIGRGAPGAGESPLSTHLPQLVRTTWRILLPAHPAEAMAMWNSALQSDEAVVFLVPREFSDQPAAAPAAAPATLPLDRAAVLHAGHHLTVVTAGPAVREVVAIAESLEDQDASVEVIDLRSLWPLDVETLRDSVSETGRVLIVNPLEDEGDMSDVVGAELARHLFAHLDHPPLAVPFERRAGCGWESDEQRNERIRAAILAAARRGRAQTATEPEEPKGPA